MVEGKGKQRLLVWGKTITDWEEEALCSRPSNLWLYKLICDLIRRDTMRKKILSCPSKEKLLKRDHYLPAPLFQHTPSSSSLYLHCPLILPPLLSPQDGSRAGRERKKTVSFSSSLSEKKISSAADCIHSMVGQQLQCDPLNKIHFQ